MEKNDVHSLFSYAEKNIALLREELKVAELKKKTLQEQALHHIADMCPEEYKRILRSSSHFLDSNNKHLDHIFFNQKFTTEQILGYSCKTIKCTHEQVGQTVEKIWLVEGKVQSISFVLEFITYILENPDEKEKKEEVKSISNLELNPSSESLNHFSQSIKESNSLISLIPGLLTYQVMQDDRKMVEDTLSSYREVEIETINETLVIRIEVDSSEVRIEWKTNYSLRGNNFFTDISVNTSQEVLMKYEGSEVYSILSQVEPLINKDEVFKFVNDLFK